MPEKLILDYSRWRCGGDGKNKLGDGIIGLLNDQGFMCCLGQWCHQVGATDEQLLNLGEPHEAGVDNPLFTVTEYDDGVNYKELYPTKFTKEAIGINDDEDTTPSQKIEKLKTLCEETGIELHIINIP